jgi:hypothetical protein
MKKRFSPFASILLLSTALPFTAVPAPSAPAAAEARLIEWDELLPEKERNSLRSAPPAPVHDYLGESAPAMTQTGSSEVNKALNGVRVRMPGYLVPLGVNDAGLATEFFLVPYFGACIHVPPPPPNQIVYIKSPKGIALESMSDAWWITGKMQTQSKGSRLGVAAYSIEPEKIELYTY